MMPNSSGGKRANSPNSGKGYHSRPRAETESQGVKRIWPWKTFAAISFVLLVFCGETPGASHLPAEILRCADIRDDATRLECYDMLVIKRQDISSPRGRVDVGDSARPETKLADVETVPEKGGAATKSRSSSSSVQALLSVHTPGIYP